MAAYLTLSEFKARTIMPSAYVTEIERTDSGWTATRLELNSAEIDARLSKRYATPFGSPAPVAVQRWLTALTTLDCYLKRGFDPTDKQGELYVRHRDEALAEVKEAASAVDGLFDLPLRGDTNASGISKGFPLAYSEQSPYAWTDGQRNVGVSEDDSGSGTVT
jgi:hypothetical protein